MKYFLASIVIIMLLTSCSNSSTSGTETEANNLENLTSESSDLQLTSTNSNIEETVLFDNDLFKLTAENIDYNDILGTSLTISAENKSDQSITLQTGYMTVNNIMVYSLLSVNIPAGETVNDSIYIMADYDSDFFGIDTIKDIELSIVALDSSNFDTIYESDSITLTTDAPESLTQDYITDGEEILNENNIKIVSLGVVEDDLDTFLKIFVENNSDQAITVFGEEFIVNGEKSVQMFSSTRVAPGKVAYDKTYIILPDNEEISADDVTDIQLTLSVNNENSMDKIVDETVVNLNFN